MPSSKHIKNLLRSAGSKQKAQLRLYKEDVDKILEKASPSRNNLQYPNGETLQLLVRYEPKGEKILGTLKKLNITKTENECTDPDVIFDDDWCFANSNNRGPIHTRATMYSCSNPFNSTEPNDRSLLLKTLRDDCVNYKEANVGVTVGIVVGASVLSAAFIGGLFYCQRNRRNHQHEQNINAEDNLQERLNPNLR